MGLFLGVAVTALVGLLVGVGGGDKPSSAKTAAAAKDTNTAPAVAGDTAAAPTGSAGDIAVPSSDTDYYRGAKPEDAAVVVVEYSDYQCPFCSRHHPTLNQVVEEYGDQVSWVYRHFPLDSIHPNATPAANAAECVGALGGNEAFWTFSDALFEQQTQLGDDLYIAEAVAAGVKEKDFTDCYEAQQYSSEIQADLSDGTTGGVTGTPGNIVMKGTDTATAQLVSGALPFTTFKQVIDSLL